MRMFKRTGLHINFKRKMTCLNILQCSRPDSQTSISVEMYEGSIANNDAYEGLSRFVGCCSRSVPQCMLRGSKKTSRGTVLGNFYVFRNVRSFY